MLRLRFEALEEEVGVISGSVVLLVGLDAGVRLQETELAGTVLLEEACSCVAFAEDVINVDLGGQVVESVQESLASVTEVISIELEVGKIALFQGGVSIVVVETVPVSHLYEGGGCVVFPVGNSIANHESLEVRNVFGRVLLVLGNVVVQSQSKFRDVDASVRFACNIDVVFTDFRELLKEIQHCDYIVISSVFIVPIAFFFLRAEGESDVCWALEIEHVGLLVPSVGVHSEGGSSIL